MSSLRGFGAGFATTYGGYGGGYGGGLSIPEEYAGIPGVGVTGSMPSGGQMGGFGYAPPSVLFDIANPSLDQGAMDQGGIAGTGIRAPDVLTGVLPPGPPGGAQGPASGSARTNPWETFSPQAGMSTTEIIQQIMGSYGPGVIEEMPSNNAPNQGGGGAPAPPRSPVPPGSTPSAGGGGGERPWWADVFGSVLPGTAPSSQGGQGPGATPPILDIPSDSNQQGAPMDDFLDSIIGGIGGLFGGGGGTGDFDLQTLLDLGIGLTDRENPEEVSIAPWLKQQPYLLEGFDRAGSLLEAGGPGVFQDDRVADLTPQQMAALGMTEARAGAGSDVLRAGQGGLSSVLGAGGTLGGNSYLEGLRRIAGGAGGTGNVREIGAQGLDPLARSTLEATARGDFVGANPYLDATYGNAASRLTESFSEDIMPGINASFSAAGRGGAGLNQLAVTDAAGQTQDALAQLASNIYGGAYETERGRQVGAGEVLGQQGIQVGGQGITAGRANQARDQFLADLGLAGTGQELEALTRMGQFQGDATSRVLDASRLAPGLAEADYADFERLFGAGSALQGQQQAEIGGAQQYFTETEDQPYDALRRYMGTVGGTNWGSQQTAGRDPNRVQSALSGAALGNRAYGPWGALAGAAAGGLF